MAEDLMDKVFSLFANDDPSDDKQNMLKQVAKDLQQCKYTKFFKIRSEEIDPSFTSYIFSIYKVIYPIKLFYQDENKVSRLKNVIIESCIDPNIKETINRLNYTALDAKIKTMPGENVIEEIKADLEKLMSQFSANHISAVNRRYELAAALAQFSSYNFKGFFKKFDPHFADGSFMIEPKFPAIKLILLVNELEAFLTVMSLLKPEDDWKGLLGILTMCEGQELVNPDQFIAMVTSLREVFASKIIELMVQYTLRNPVWAWKRVSFKETIGEEWLEEKKAEAVAYVQKINNVKKNSQINALTKQIFEATDLVRLDNYTVQLSESLKKKKVECYIYAEGLNYLKAFLDDYVDKEIKELSDILLIRGQWTNNAMSREMSEALNRLFEADGPINDLDTVLADEGGDGSRLRPALQRVDRDPSQVRYINSIVSNNNDKALEIINQAAQDLIVVGKHLKNLIEDLQKKHPELMLNWKELNLVSKDPLNQRMVADFKRVNYFVQLMHLCTQ
jgi:hypothetical protein